MIILDSEREKDSRFFRSYVPIKKYEETPEDEMFLGYIKGYAATNDLDRQDEIITENALLNGAKSLGENTAVFYNHNWDGDPIGKVVSSKYIQEGDFAAIEVTVGISKTEPNKWELIKNGSLSKFSIGGYLLDYEYKEVEKDKYIGYIKDMNTLEVSVVGIPANAGASFGVALTRTLKQLRKEQVRKLMEDKQEQEIKAQEESRLNSMEEKLEVLGKQFETAIGSFNKSIEAITKALEPKEEPAPQPEVVDKGIVQPKQEEIEEDTTTKREAPLTKNKGENMEYRDKNHELAEHLRVLGKALQEREPAMVIELVASQDHDIQLGKD